MEPENDYQDQIKQAEQQLENARDSLKGATDRESLLGAQEEFNYARNKLRRLQEEAEASARAAAEQAKIQQNLENEEELEARKRAKLEEAEEEDDFRRSVEEEQQDADAQRQQGEEDEEQEDEGQEDEGQEEQKDKKEQEKDKEKDKSSQDDKSNGDQTSSKEQKTSNDSGASQADSSASSSKPVESSSAGGSSASSAGSSSGATAGGSAAEGTAAGSSAAGSSAAGGAATGSTTVGGTAASGVGGTTAAGVGGSTAAAGVGGSTVAAGTAASGAAASGAVAGGAAAGGAAAGGAAVAATPVGWVILIIIVAIIVIINLIGLVSFIFTMPDMIIGKLGEFLQNIWDKFEAIFVGQADALVNQDDLLKVGQYLDNMGYDIEGFGFGTIERDEETNEITKVNSEYIRQYLIQENRTYMISNQDFNFKSWFESIGDGTFFEEGAWGDGMIVLNISGTMNALEKILNVVTIGAVGEIKSNTFRIDRENKVMYMYLDGNEIVCYLEDWVGKYGKPLELLLSLHIGTMAPDFAYNVATDEELQTKVYVNLHICEQSTKVTMLDNYGNTLVDDVSALTDDQLEYYGITEEQRDEASRFTSEHRTYTPYITEVKKHWYRDLVFYREGVVDCYGQLETKISLDPVYQSDSESPLADGPFYIRKTNIGDIQQVKAPYYVDNGVYRIMQLIEDEEYVLYDGTIKDEEDRPKGKIGPTETMQYALALLSGVKTQAAEYILRDVKELMGYYGFEFTEEAGYYEYLVTDPEDQTSVTDEKILNRVSGYLRPDGTIANELSFQAPESLNANLYNSSLSINARSTGSTGFKQGKNVFAINNGQVISKTDNSIAIKLENNMTIYISNIEVNQEIQVKDYVQISDSIGKTTDKDITIVMKDTNHKIINAEEYIDIKTMIEK